MPLIMAINPIKKRPAKTRRRKKQIVKKTRRITKPAKQKEIKKMATKKRSIPQVVIHKTAAPRKRSRSRRRVVHANPASRSRARRAAAFGRSAIGGINIGGAARSALPMIVGALLTKFAAKKWGGDPSATEGENWTWKHYIVGLLGGFAGAFATSAIFKGRREIAQKVFEGSMLLTLYKILINEVAAKNESLTTWFGQDDESLPELPANYKGLRGDGYAPGQVYEADEAVYVKGNDGFWRPVNDAGRANQVSGFLGDVVRPVDPTMGYLGDVVRPVDPTMGHLGQTDAAKAWADLYPQS